MQEFLVKNLGFLAGFLTTIAFLPQVFRVWSTKSTKDISIWMFLIFTTGVFLWLIYGLIIMNNSLIVANTITLILSLSILIAKILFKWLKYLLENFRKKKYSFSMGSFIIIYATKHWLLKKKYLFSPLQSIKHHLMCLA